jgi:hypothetical protein
VRFVGPALKVIIVPNNGDFVDVIVLYNRIVSVSLLSSATRYGLDGSGIEPGGSEIFLTYPDLAWGPPSLLYSGYRVIPVAKAAGAWR